MEKFSCLFCGQSVETEDDDLCLACGQVWEEYFERCEAFRVNPCLDGFVEFGGNPEVWDHLA